jgi:hypothetical protein
MGQGSAGTGRRGLRADAGGRARTRRRPSPVGSPTLALAGNGRMGPDSLDRLLQKAPAAVAEGAKVGQKLAAQVLATHSRKALFPGPFE